MALCLLPFSPKHSVANVAAGLVFLCLAPAPLARAQAAAATSPPASLPPEPQADVVDGVAAVVNGDVITFSQVREVVAARERALRSQFSGGDLTAKIKEARLGALKDLIDRQLIIQEFKKKEFQIPNRFVEERVQTIIREEFGGDRQAFVRTLQAQGYTMNKFRDMERDKIIVLAMRSNNVKDNFIVSPNKIEQAYNTAKPEYTTPEQVKLRLISVAKGTGAEVAAQRGLAEEIRSKLVAGAKFDQLARMYSEDSSREAGGDWGWVDRKTLNEGLTKVAFRLKPKQVSEIVDQDNTLYLLMVEERKESFTKPITDVRQELERRLSADEKQKLQQQWIEGLRKKAYIKMF